MRKRKIFISFDYENDKHYKFLLEAWDSNKMFNFSFNDYSTKEINSWDISRIKATLAIKIKEADLTLVIIGKYANSTHPDALEIGFKNWINWEIARSKEYGKKLIAVKINSSNTSPDEILNSNASWAHSFTQENIISAINRC